MVSKRVQLRLATLLLLMISDLDYLFSFLFMNVLLQTFISPPGGGKQNILYAFSFGVVVAGQIIYFIGILHFGPRQKTRIAAKVKEFMTDHPEQMWSTKYTQNITWASTIFPQDPKSKARHKTFTQLDLTLAEDREEMHNGLNEWGFAEVWEGVEKKNAWNCLKLLHGLPLMRLARYGFQAQPAPKDLSGILNANALYTFAIGFFQLALGMILLFETWAVTPMSDKVATIVPWTISFVSAVLSFVNVIKDFSGMLVQMENEEELQKNIQVKNEKELRDNKEKVEREHKRKLEEIETEYTVTDNRSNDKLAENHANKMKALAEENGRYISAIQAAEAATLLILEVELSNYRAKLETVEKLLSGKRVQMQEGDTTGAALKRAQDQNKQATKLQEVIDGKRKQEMDELTAKVERGESVETFAEDLAKIKQKYDDMLNDVTKVLGDGRAPPQKEKAPDNSQVD